MYSNEEMKKVQFANGALAEAGFSGLKLNDINKFMTMLLISPTQLMQGSFNAAGVWTIEVGYVYDSHAALICFVEFSAITLV